MQQYYYVMVDGKPVAHHDGKLCTYTRGEAIKKARLFNGKIEAVPEDVNIKENLKEALRGLQAAFVNVLDVCDHEAEFNSKYPFHKCFIELTHDVIDWVDSEVEAE